MKPDYVQSRETISMGGAGLVDKPYMVHDVTVIIIVPALVLL